MAFLDNFKNALRPYDDDDYIENEATEEETAAFEPVPEPQPAPSQEEYSEPKPKFGRKEHRAYAAPQPAPAPEKARMRLMLITPTEFDEAAEIADNLKDRRAVLMNVEKTDNETARRLIDFLSGVVYALGGKIMRISAQAYVLTPTNVDLVGEGMADLESAGLYF